LAPDLDPTSIDPMKFRMTLLLLIAVAIGAFLWLGGAQFFTLEFLRGRYDELQAIAEGEWLLAATVFSLLYIALASLNVPGAAAVLTLAGGALFGLAWGTVLVSFASSIGATFGFLLSRFLLRDWVERRFPAEAARVNEGIQRDGALYLFSVRIVAVFPFFIINMLMGLTRLRTSTFYWVSQVSMLPGTAIYVNAGTQLNRIDSASDIMSPAVAGSFLLLGIFPLLTKWIMNAVNARRHPRA
jgi:uncharacterized membrane protein YdjX (TVP38/TMEM64 family)